MAAVVVVAAQAATAEIQSPVACAAAGSVRMTAVWTRLVTGFECSGKAIVDSLAI